MSDENKASLWMEVEELRREVNELKTSLLDVATKNTRRESEDDCTAVRDQRLSESVDERNFSEDLLRRPQKSSSFMSLLPSQTSSSEDLFSSRFIYHRLKDPRRLMGEIAFQLDRRILSYVFQEQSRLYGFTVQNIKDKIEQVSTHPLTGKVDEAYKHQLVKRHTEIMDRLQILGYNMSLHPPFTEFIINTYGILKELPGVYGDQDTTSLNNPEFLRKVIVENAPSKLLKDLLLLLSCLCFMSRQDGKSLLLW
ncbi:speriolin-like protein [Paramisgurnus dabryanus]|uniref:speriolin-like protein n=1 Tax=Paramisgurnus dabryanus TaxID=90735 RepID=UPI0031F363C1